MAGLFSRAFTKVILTIPKKIFTTKREIPDLDFFKAKTKIITEKLEKKSPTSISKPIKLPNSPALQELKIKMPDASGNLPSNKVTLYYVKNFFKKTISTTNKGSNQL